jgi:hypothetical protein
MMSVCTIDNPATMQRECWHDGKLICAVHGALFFIEPFPVPRERFFFGANIGDWKTGQIIGDPKAMLSAGKGEAE